MRELKLDERQFLLFNQGDQFQIFADELGHRSYEDCEQEGKILFLTIEKIIVTENGYIYAETNGKRVLLSDRSDDSYHVAVDVIEIIG